QTAGVDFVRVVVFFEFVPALPGDGSTYYYDDIEVFTPASTPVALPVTFEDPTANYQFVGFEGADSAIEANPVSGGINTSATVMRSTKTVGAQFFAGTALELDTPIDFSASEIINIKTYSPKDAIPVKLRLENSDNSVGIEVDVNTTVVDEWETLSYDFSGQTAGVDFVRVVVFFEFVDGLAGDGSTYFYDDITVAETMGVDENNLLNAVVYPNPATDLVFVQSEVEISEIQLISITGQLVKSIQPNGTQAEINIEALSTGVYVVQLTSKEGSRQSMKLVKQ
ncbi:MAG: T9SS type A sorting domain-containing protein, partial [Marinirhabdus sp.]|nr:T9SS type A sorting domain-containing protein [Marinirhabdus sp.]